MVIQNRKDDQLMRFIKLVSRVLMAIALAGATGPAPHAEPPAQQDQRVQIDWRMPTPQHAAVSERLDFSGKTTFEQDPNHRGTPLFVVLAGLAYLPSVVEAVVSVYRQVVYGGVIINVCGEKLEIHNDRAIPGEVIVVRCGPKVVIYRSTDVQGADLKKAIDTALQMRVDDDIRK
jgi:hypothetical protein